MSEAQGAAVPGSPPAPLQPLARLHYRLTPADALAWEAIPREWSRRKLWLVLAGFGALGAVYGLLEDSLALHSLAARLPVILGLAALGWLALVAIGTLATRRRARRRLPVPVEAVLEIWPDHLAEWRDGRPAPLIVAPETIRQVVATPGHVFLDVPPGLLILPAAAFPEGDHRAFAEHWEALSQAAAD